MASKKRFSEFLTLINMMKLVSITFSVCIIRNAVEYKEYPFMSSS